MKRFILSIITLITFCGFTIGCYQDNHVISNEQRNSYSVTELKDLFGVYHNDFTEVANIVLQNEYLEQAMIRSKEEVVSFETATIKDYFSQNEWEVIERLFHETGLFRIERNSKGAAKTDTVKFLYRTSNFTTTLYFCQTEDESDMEYFRLQTKQFEMVENNWWVGYREDLTGGT